MKKQVGTVYAVLSKRLFKSIIKARFICHKPFNEEFSDEWTLPYHEVDNVTELTTVVELKNLIVKITETCIVQLRKHIGMFHIKFLANKSLKIKLNKDSVKTIVFYDRWQILLIIHLQIIRVYSGCVIMGRCKFKLQVV